MAIDKEGKRVREVVTSDEVPHLWAHQTQDTARNKQGNFYFRGNTIFSYRESFPLASWIDGASGEFAGVRGVLVTTRKYSNTTSKQLYNVKRAIPHSVEDNGAVFNVPLYGSQAHDNPDRWYASYRLRIDEALEKARKARARSREFLREFTRLRGELNRFIAFFAMDRRKFRVPEMPGDWMQLQERAGVEAAKQAERDRTSAVRREERRAKRQAVIWGPVEERIEKWLAGERVSTWGFPSVLLRVEKDEVVTSMGARVPREHAVRAFGILRRVAQTGPVLTQVRGVRIGHYTVEGFDGETLVIGCHRIAWSECERLVSTLNAQSVESVQVG